MGVSILDAYGKPLEVARQRLDIKDVARILLRESGEGDAAKVRANYPFRQNIWIYATVMAIASAGAEAPFGLWQPAGRRNGRSRFTSKNYVQVNNTKLDMLLDTPNDWQSMQRFVEQWITFLLLGGNVWIYKDEPNSLGVPRALLLFGADMIKPVRSRANVPPTAWELRLPGGTAKQFPLDAFVHSMLPNDLDQYLGLPPWMAMAVQLDADRARVLYDRSFYENNATPDAVLTYKPGPLSHTSRTQIYEAWNEAYGGVERAGGVAVIGGDFDLKTLGVTHAQSEFLRSREFTRQEAASAYGYPVQLLNVLESGGLGRDQLTVARMIKYEQAVFPVTHRLEQDFTRGIVRPYIEDRSIGAYCDWDGHPVMVDMMEKKVKILRDMTASGIPLNEAMNKLDLGIDPVAGGEKGYIEKNKIPLEIAADPPPEPEPQAPKQITDDTGEDPEDVEDEDEDEDEEEEERSGVWDDKYAELAPLVASGTKSIKRVLFELRNACWRGSSTSPFDPASTKVRIKRRLLPVSIGAAQIGFDLVMGRKPWPTRVKSVDKVVSNLRLILNDAGVQHRVADMLTGQIDLMLGFIDRLYKELMRTDNTTYESQVRDSFQYLTPFARALVKQEVIRSYNMGVKQSSQKDAVMVIPYPSGCSSHGNKPHLEKDFTQADGCLCIVSAQEVI